MESHCLKLLGHFYRHGGHVAAAAGGEDRLRPLLNREDTVDFLVKGLLRGISSGYQCLDASRKVQQQMALTQSTGITLNENPLNSLGAGFYKRVMTMNRVYVTD